jgi:DNA-directed RNA polymerase subunit RPC12/RpoP
MDYRCPVCRAELPRRGLGRSIVVRMEFECTHCGSVIRHNPNPIEMVVVVSGFGTFVVLGACAYALESHALALSAFGVAVLGSIFPALLEHTWLRSWPRYARGGGAPLRP